MTMTLEELKTLSKAADCGEGDWYKGLYGNCNLIAFDGSDVTPVAEMSNARAAFVAALVNWFRSQNAALQNSTTEWQPIETAPKNGTPILIWDGNTQCVARMEFWFTGHEGSWVCIGASGYECSSNFDSPTHWMPLPERPLERKLGKGD